MNETSCDIHDVTRAASDLVAVGCNIGMTHLSDGFTRLRFSSIISAYANEVIQAVDEGVISAWQGVQELISEYEELSSKARFYLQNGVGVAAGVMQVRAGVAATAIPGGIGVIPGGFLISHGTNNIYEGVGNIYNGPDVPGTIGPLRYMYRAVIKDDYQADMVYYSLDLILSGYGMYRKIPKYGAFELFRHDPINYERAYHQTGKLALALEALVDSFTINTMLLQFRGR
ncbi:DUF4225 domain-containing protein [Pseudomonas sp. A-RE-19]|uniref:DUF4225 domain-containing protein n=1 Tax=Pseudomonas sp. A-RE-19 TaxID=2832401 RepID=UPI001CBB3C65|nr:DUF4225 domain-containing protein [Pseudomonas sp. A-RE-19]